jgi:AraC-like DNA-binding protein
MDINSSKSETHLRFDHEAGMRNYKSSTKAVLHFIETHPQQSLFVKNMFMDTYDLIHSACGDDGFEDAASKKPDIIIIDVSAQHINGIALCKKLKDDARTCHIPVVLLTDNTSDQQILEGLECGCDDYISKTLSSYILPVKIKNLINTRRILSRNFLNEHGYDIIPADIKFIKKAYRIVEENIDDSTFGVNDFAKAIGMSRAQLYRKIDSISGQSVKEFIRIIRLKKAAEMLIKTSYNISEIAYKVGFNSIAYFTKSFSNLYGLAPSKYISGYDTGAIYINH